MYHKLPQILQNYIRLWSGEKDMEVRLQPMYNIKGDVVYTLYLLKNNKVLAASHALHLESETGVLVFRGKDLYWRELL